MFIRNRAGCCELPKQILYLRYSVMLTTLRVGGTSLRLTFFFQGELFHIFSLLHFPLKRGNALRCSNKLFRNTCATFRQTILVSFAANAQELCKRKDVVAHPNGANARVKTQ